MDTASRKQLLLTRIALDRVELRAEVAGVRDAIGMPLLWRALVGADLGRTLLGAGPTGGAGWLRAALALLRRYRWAATIISGVVPMLRRPRPSRGIWRRVLRLGKLGAIGLATWAGWRALRGRQERRVR